MRNYWLIAAGISGAVAVAMGAYGAHGLGAALVRLGFSQLEVESRIAERFEPAVLYHLVHSLALALVAVAGEYRRTMPLRIAGGGFFIGILMFSGLLYVLTFRSIGGLGAVVPLGGVAYIVGWLALGVEGLRRRGVAD